MYDIIRFSYKNRKRLIFRGVTKEQAHEWCNNPLTRKEGEWFDGFDDMNNHLTNNKPKYSRYHSPTPEYL